MRSRWLSSLGFGLWAAVVAAVPGSVAAQRSPTSDIDAIYPDIETLYKDLHRNPELAFQETQTVAKLSARLKALGYDVTTGVGKTGIVAVMKRILRVPLTVDLDGPVG